MFAKADAAIVGVVTAVDEPADPNADVVVTIRVDEVFKGDPGDAVRLVEDANSSCAFLPPVGQRVTLLLHRTRAGWATSPCERISREQMIAAGRPLPRPNGVGPVRFLVGGSVGAARTVALDAYGRTLGYGLRDGETWRYSVCPGAGRVAELVSFENRVAIAVRDLRTLRVVWRSSLGAAQRIQVSGLSCRDASGRTVLAYLEDYSRGPNRLVAVRAGGTATVRADGARSAAFAGERAFLVRRVGIAALDLQTGAVAWGAREHRFHGEPAVSPMETLLAAATRTHVVVLDVRSHEPRVVARRARPRGAFVSDLVWASATRLVVTHGIEGPERLSVFTAGLERVAERRWNWARPIVSHRGSIYAIAEGTLYRARLPRGPIRVVRRFPSPTTYALAAVGGTTRVDRAARTRSSAWAAALRVSAGCRAAGPGRSSRSPARFAR